mmetsp:Transcript_805/g.1821  ORF Transcript_805/g.1821 Transcript_805/m.1821 type:complete len:336 (-) Transcript_805:79-1086(-)
MKEEIHILGLGELLHRGPELTCLFSEIIVTRHYIESNVLDVITANGTNTKCLIHLSNRQQCATHDCILSKKFTTIQTMTKRVNGDLRRKTNVRIGECIVAVKAVNSLVKEQVIPARPEGIGALHVLEYGLNRSPIVTVGLILIDCSNIVVNNIRVRHIQIQQPRFCGLLLVASVRKQHLVHAPWCPDNVLSSEPRGVMIRRLVGGNTISRSSKRKNFTITPRLGGNVVAQIFAVVFILLPHGEISFGFFGTTHVLSNSNHVSRKDKVSQPFHISISIRTAVHQSRVSGRRIIHITRIIDDCVQLHTVTARHHEFFVSVVRDWRLGNHSLRDQIAT